MSGALVRRWPAPVAVVLLWSVCALQRAGAHDVEEPKPEVQYGAAAVVKRPHPEAASTSHVHETDIAAVPLRTAEDALRLVPGLTLVQHGSEGKGQQYFLRGFDAVHGADLELTVEDIPINEWSNVHAQGYLDVGFVIPELIQTVEVIKGPFQLTQGPFAMAGSARYRLGVASQDLGMRASYTTSTTLRQRLMASYSPQHGDGSQFVAVELLHDPAYGQARQARRMSTLARVHLLDSERRGRLSFLASGYAADFGLPGTLRAVDVEAGGSAREQNLEADKLGFYDAYFQHGTGSSFRALAALQYRLEQAGHEVRATLYGGYRKLSLFENFTGYLYDPVHGDFRDQRHEAASLGLRLNWDIPLNSKLSLLSGLGAHGDLLTQKERHTDSERDFVDLRRALTGVQLLANAQLGLAYRPRPVFQLEAGLRAELVHAQVDDQVAQGATRARTLGALSPRAVASLRATPQLKLFTAYGRGLRPPEARALTSYDPLQGVSEEGAQTGKPQITQSHTVELGARLRPDATLSLHGSGFATLIEKESVFDHVSSSNLELNGTRRLGAEAVLSWSPLPWLRLSADVTGVDARFRESHNRVPFAPWLTSGARLLLNHPSGARAGLRFLAVAPRPLPHGARGEALYLLDLSAGYRRHWFDLNLALENLLFRELREGEYHFASHWDQAQPASAIPTTQIVAGPPFNARVTLAVIF